MEEILVRYQRRERKIAKESAFIDYFLRNE